MTKETAKKIVELNKQSYNTISTAFSETRQYAWPIFDYLSKFINQNDKIIDIGCGNGRLLNSLTSKNIEYLGLDFSENLITEAKKLHPNDKFITSNLIEKLPLRDNNFNSAFLIAVLNHLPEEETRLNLLKEINRILKPGGYLMITNFNLLKLDFSKKGILKYITKKLFTQDNVWQSQFGFSKYELSFKDVLTFWQGGGKSAYLYYYAFTKNELNNLAKKAGFKVIDSFYEKNGTHKNWYNGANLVHILQKINR